MELAGSRHGKSGVGYSTQYGVLDLLFRGFQLLDKTGFFKLGLYRRWHPGPWQARVRLKLSVGFGVPASAGWMCVCPGFKTGRQFQSHGLPPPACQTQVVCPS